MRLDIKPSAGMAPTESPETKKLRQDFEHWVGEANDRIRRILVPDQTLMDQAQARVVSVIYRERHHGKTNQDIRWGSDLSSIAKSLDDDQRDRVVALYQRKVAARDRLVSTLGGRKDGESWNGFCARVRHPWDVMRVTAAVMASHGLHRASPPLPVVAAKRRTLTDADHDQRAREADQIASGWVGGAP